MTTNPAAYIKAMFNRLLRYQGLAIRKLYLAKIRVFSKLKAIELLYGKMIADMAIYYKRCIVTNCYNTERSLFIIIGYQCFHKSTSQYQTCYSIVSIVRFSYSSTG
ncbi:hypothetical protein PHYBLDRAFT_162619 [Phycomyces blakesleeanus NRRL 1555(-)]|uniref:Uncharacterized protein n=1 Tax=Phycomyces blakesleeanus (strain ATCC 8743b / DSM 1359 / FGSC 10004 / NBRC 33097 / NRRL 1555) TaxID=763407 RepID=A0A162V2Q3_PHYB8|nr:hypothetical protein PHYBLDRAFT_162619 [Phycomyces blakesleeanus NRRL 1555(-)]OAD79562.1 hypothetical protein PHYBLDRAFT_162619 [Phycomyces blakesleeanus NRRL 1555(-)]|eukprot:XP_018297602.1 hypothetical protein PHYBLDRAFT_162619 [Phycomyces blakesleeanus NRRL 1555(-)]